MDEKINQFMASFAPWGYRDMETAIKMYEIAGQYVDDLAGAVQDFSNDTGIDLASIDVCYVAMDTLYQEARTEIQNHTGVDISNDEPYSSIEVFGNYMCTTLDGSDEAFTALVALIDTVPHKSKVLEWLRAEAER